MSYSLFLDDERFPKDVTWVNLPAVKWIIARSYEDFVRIITENGLPEHVSFDHDLADEHYKEYISANNKLLLDSSKRIRYETFREKTGYDCAKWLAQYCIDKTLPLPLYYLHSMNGIGCGNMFSVLESARKIINGT